MKKGILERLKEGPVLGDGGYLLELEKRGWVRAGPFTPEVALLNPEALRQLHIEFREAGAEGKLIRLPTGDGMALVFRTDPEAPAQCALEIARALKEHPRIALRMGIHSGPVNEVLDVNQRQNIAGAGINMAQ